MPRAKGERINKKRANLTDYGLWFWRIADTLGVDDTIVAQRSVEVAQKNKISQATISKSTRFARAGEEVLIPSLNTTRKIFSTLELIAREEGKQIPYEVKRLFYHASPGQHATEEEAFESQQCLQQRHHVITTIDRSPDKN